MTTRPQDFVNTLAQAYPELSVGLPLPACAVCFARGPFSFKITLRNRCSELLRSEGHHSDSINAILSGLNRRT